MDIAALVQSLTISALPIIFAITLHEAAHGYAARHFGDPTAWMLGRISANPLRHIDPIGTLLVPAVIVFTSYVALDSVFIFGWAKPVPVNFGRLRNPKRDMLWVAGAGPAANLAMALAWALLFKLVTLMPIHAYSLPLAAHARDTGHAAIQMSGALQLLFGIRGKRWDDHPIISKLYNDAWVRPEETLAHKEKVEGGSYWYSVRRPENNKRMYLCVFS